MSEIINSSYKLKKIHRIILKNENHSVNKYIKEKLINNRNKKLFNKKNSRNNNNKDINLNALICPNMEKINKIQNEIKNQYNKKYTSIYTINNNNTINPKMRNKYFKDEIETRKTYTNQRINTPKYKINKSTNISIELKRKKQNNNYNYNIGDIHEDKIMSIEKNELSNFDFFKPKKFIFENMKNTYKEYSSPINNQNKNRINIINKKTNFVMNTKSLNPKLFNEQKEKKNIFSNKTLNNNNFKNLSFKIDRTIQSLKYNYIWNDYTQVLKNKKIEQIINKRKKKEDINNMIKLFRDSYSFKKLKNKTNMNDKEKYLNYLDDHTLGLRENIIKTYLHHDRGGKQNIRQYYNPLDV